MGQPLFVRAAGFCERLYRALEVLPFLEGELEQKTRLTVLGEDLTLPEFEYARRGGLFEYGAVIAAGGAGVYTGVGIEGMNGYPNAGTLGIIERFILSNPNATTQVWAWGFGIIGIAVTPVTPNKRDDRMLSSAVPGSVPALRIGTYSNVASPNSGNGGFVRLLPDETVIVEGPWIYSGQEQFVWRTAANVSTVLTVQWRERPASALELSK